MNKNSQKTKKIIVGIDPGFSGAIAFYNPATKQLKVCDLPIKKVLNKKQMDICSLNKILLPFIPFISFVAIEDVHSMPEQGVVSMFRFGYNAGILLGVLETNNLKVLRLKPSSWKSALNLSSDKQKSLDLAKKTFSPIYTDYFMRKKDDGRAEAALIAFYASQCF